MDSDDSIFIRIDIWKLRKGKGGERCYNKKGRNCGDNRGYGIEEGWRRLLWDDSIGGVGSYSNLIWRGCVDEENWKEWGGWYRKEEIIYMERCFKK